MSSLLRPSEFSAPVSTDLKFSLCQRAFWTPRREDRITLMSSTIPPNPTKFATFDMKLEEIGNKVTIQGHLVASFSLQDCKERAEWMGVSDKDVIVCSTGSSLLLFNINGLRLQAFQYCPEEILRLCVVCLECFPSSGFFFLNRFTFFKLHTVGVCAHMHLSVCKHLQRSQVDFLVLVTFSLNTGSEYQACSASAFP
uniref:Uncharacterized protein n=1 Tax=Mus spicilegus TaxID=10103 RepID=A0A8C6MS88_MUSSI